MRPRSHRGDVEARSPAPVPPRAGVVASFFQSARSMARVGGAARRIRAPRVRPRPRPQRGLAPRGRRPREQPAPPRRTARDRGRARCPDDPGPVRRGDGRALLLGERRHGALEAGEKREAPDERERERERERGAESVEARHPSRRAPRVRGAVRSRRDAHLARRVPAPTGVQLRARARRAAAPRPRARHRLRRGRPRRAGERAVARAARRHAHRGRCFAQ